MRPGKKARRLLKLAEVIEAKGDDAFDMGFWCHTSEFSTDDLDEVLEAMTAPSCGTTACIAGWAVTLWPKEAKGISARNQWTGVEPAARAILGYAEEKTYEGEYSSATYMAYTDDFNNLFYGPWDTAALAAAELRRRAAVLIEGMLADAG